MVGVFWGCFAGLFLGGSGGLVHHPGVSLHGFQGVSKYKLFSPGIQVFLFFLDFGVFGNATWILKSTSGLRVTRAGFEA